MHLLRHSASALFAATLLCALVLLGLPQPAKAVTRTVPGCCQHMNMASADPDQPHCPAHLPAKEKQDGQPDSSPCCQACTTNLAVVALAGAPFIYTFTGETTLVSLALRGHVRPHQPPVPPPRHALV